MGQNNIPKRHHYLPKSYLQKFTSTDEKFWLYDPSREVFRIQTPINTAVQEHYFSFRNADGTYNPTIEIARGNIESGASEAIKRLDKQVKLTNADKKTLSYFMALLLLGVPKFEDTINSATEVFVKKLLGKLAQTETMQKVLDHLTDELPPDTPHDIAEQTISFIKHDKYSLEIDRNKSLRIFTEMVPEIANRFQLMTWAIIRADSKTSFITSDNPFVISPGSVEELRKGSTVGILTDGSQKFLPLSPRTGLMLLDSGQDMHYKIASTDFVRQLNLRLAVQTTRFLIAKDEAHLRRIVKQVGFFPTFEKSEGSVITI